VSIDEKAKVCDDAEEPEVVDGDTDTQLSTEPLVEIRAQFAHRLCRYERDAEVCFGPSVVSVTLESLAPDFGGQVRRAYLSGPPEVSLIAEPPLTWRPPMLDHVTYLYGFNLEFAERLVKDLSDEQMAAQSGGVINHPAWSLGHLVVAADHLGQLLGLESTLAEGWGETFKTGEEPSDDASYYPSKEEILGALRQQHERNVEVAKSTDASRFAEPHPNEATRDHFPTVGDMVVFLMTSHEMDHLGQIAAWRRAMGLGPAERD